MKAVSVLAVLVLSLAPTFGARATTLGSWCERALKQRMVAPAPVHRIVRTESVEPVYFDPFWSGPEFVFWPPPATRHAAWVDYEVRRFGVPMRSTAKCVVGLN